MELSPDLRKSANLRSQISPQKENSTISKRSSVMPSPSTFGSGGAGTRSSHYLDMHKKTGTE